MYSNKHQHGRAKVYLFHTLKSTLQIVTLLNYFGIFYWKFRLCQIYVNLTVLQPKSDLT